MAICSQDTSLVLYGTKAARSAILKVASVLVTIFKIGYARTKLIM